MLISAILIGLIGIVIYHGHWINDNIISVFGIVAGFIVGVVGFIVGVVGVVGVVGGFIGGVVACSLTDNIIKTQKNYFVPYILSILLLSSFLLFSIYKIPSDKLWYAKEDGKMINRVVFIPVVFQTLDEKYFTFKKLPPIPVEVNIIFPTNTDGVRMRNIITGIVYVDVEPLTLQTYYKLQHWKFRFNSKKCVAGMT